MTSEDTGQLWDADISISTEDARKMVEAQFPDLVIRDFRFVTEGWDNRAFLLNDEIVFRFPRRHIAVDLIRTESRILPLLVPQLSLPIPEPIYLGEPDESFPWPFAGYRWLQGTTACRMNLNDDERSRLAKPLARFLRELHSVSLPEGVDLYPDVHGRNDITNQVEKITERLDRMVQVGAIDDASSLKDLAERLAAQSALSKKAVCHGDLYCRHLLLDDRRELCGVIDWGDLHYGDIAWDLGIVHAFLPLGAHETFFAEYGDVLDAARFMARLSALYKAVALALYAYEEGITELYRESMQAIKWAREA